MYRQTRHFSFSARMLHWIMAAMIMSMLLIGLDRNLLWLHEPLGISILVLALIRIHVRLNNDPPPLPEDIPAVQRHAARLSHLLLYALMVIMPLVGWSMVSAEGGPIVLMGWLHLPSIMPHDIHLYRVLRKTHMWLAILLAATFGMHVLAALYHALVRQDGVFSSMASSGRSADTEW
jgi:cytochrome b561